MKFYDHKFIVNPYVSTGEYLHFCFASTGNSSGLECSLTGYGGFSFGASTSKWHILSKSHLTFLQYLLFRKIIMQEPTLIYGFDSLYATKPSNKQFIFSFFFAGGGGAVMCEKLKILKEKNMRNLLRSTARMNPIR